MLNILKIPIVCMRIYHSYPKERKLVNARSFYVICMIKTLCCSHKVIKQDLNHGLILKKVHRVIQFYQKARLKPYIDMNTKLRKKDKK